MAMPPIPSVTYLPGRWCALAANDVWLLADLDPSSPILAACWETVERGGGVDGLLGVILREGLRSVPSFALVGAGPDGYRLLVSGKAQAEAISPDRREPTLVSAAEAPTWIEKRLDGHPDIRLRADDAALGEPGIALPLSGGVVLASAVLVGGMESFARDAAPAVATHVAEPGSVAAVPGNATADFDPTGIAAEAERGLAAHESQPAADAEPVGEVPAADSVPRPPPTLTNPIEDFDYPADPETDQPAGPETVGPDDAAPNIEDISGAGPARTFDHLFGTTGNPIEDLGPPATSSPSDDTMQPKPQDDPGPGTEPPPPAEVPAPPPAAPVAPALAEPSQPAVIESLPWQLPADFGLGDPGPEPHAPPAPPAPQAQPPQAEPPEARPTQAEPPQARPTQARPTQARPTRAGPPRPPAAPVDPYAPGPPSDPFAPTVASPPPQYGSEPPGYAPPGHTPHAQQHAPGHLAGPTVHAVSCPNQHLNPPYATNCRVCGLAIGQQEPFPAERPTLGILNMSTGDMVPLDRDVVLGRAPFHADKSAQSRPHLVQLASPGNDISRSHVRVGIEGWHVQVTDLGSTNGTVVTIPGQAPVRLRAHDPFTIVPGSTITIADEVNVRFEVAT